MSTNKEINFYLKNREFGWLSNFYPCRLRINNGEMWPTVEHFYQAHKSNKREVVEWIGKAPSPYLAMKAGRSLREKDGFDKEQWEEDKIFWMREGLLMKFGQNPELRKKLLDTGNAVLHEDSPTDRFWGKLGQDMLGKLLMEVREKMKEEEYVMYGNK